MKIYTDSNAELERTCVYTNEKVRANCHIAHKQTNEQASTQTHTQYNTMHIDFG